MSRPPASPSGPREEWLRGLTVRITVPEPVADRAIGTSHWDAKTPAPAVPAALAGRGSDGDGE